MAQINTPADARRIAKDLLEQAIGPANGLAAMSGDVPRARTAAIVAEALLHLADSMDEESTNDE